MAGKSEEEAMAYKKPLSEEEAYQRLLSGLIDDMKCGKVIGVSYSSTLYLCGEIYKNCLIFINDYDDCTSKIFNLEKVITAKVYDNKKWLLDAIAPYMNELLEFVENKFNISIEDLTHGNFYYL